jgi:hypothetical protein
MCHLMPCSETAVVQPKSQRRYSHRSAPQMSYKISVRFHSSARPRCGVVIGRDAFSCLSSVSHVLSPAFQRVARPRTTPAHARPAPVHSMEQSRRQTRVLAFHVRKTGRRPHSFTSAIEHPAFQLPNMSRAVTYKESYLDSSHRCAFKTEMLTL